MQCTEVTGLAALQCIFVQAPSQPEGKQQPKKPIPSPVPLWPTYVLAGAPVDKAEEPWLLLGHAENWIARIAALTLTASRPNGRRELVNCLRKLWVPRFQVALRAARKSNGADDDEQDDSGVQDDDPAEKVIGQKELACKKQVCYDVGIEGHTMTVVNSLRPIVLQLDHRTIAFLSTHFATSAATLAHSQLKVPTAAPKAAAPFTFTPELLRNFRAKLVWIPTMHTWKLEVHKPKETVDDSSLCFRVEPSLAPADYMAAKVDAYVKAIRAWNKLDGSTRTRIAVPMLGDADWEVVEPVESGQGAVDCESDHGDDN